LTLKKQTTLLHVGAEGLPGHSPGLPAARLRWLDVGMLQLRRSGSGATADRRSSSTPSWFAKNCGSPPPERDERTGKPDREKSSAGTGAGVRAGSGSSGAQDFRSGSKGGGNASRSPNAQRERAHPAQGELTRTSTDDSAPRTPALRNTEPEIEADLPEEFVECADFVEGGVELSPPRSNVDDEFFVGEGSSASTATRPLLQLEDRQLEEFWPRGAGSPKAVFLDYDGTLREFENKPELAVPTDEINELLRRINERLDFVPHIISGRSASFLERHFGHLSRFTLVAEHGFQIWRATSGTWTLWDGTIDHEIWKASIRDAMQRIVNEMPGSHLEEKASHLVWHYRGVEDQPMAEAKASDVIRNLSTLVDEGRIPDVRISHGHKIVEASYRNVRKGPVMRKLCEEQAILHEPFGGVLAAGDDVSDESMFDAAPSDYLTVKVGAAQTSARFRVDSPRDLRQFLGKLLDF